MSISVAMTVYNGEKYLTKQINSILCQLNFSDELIISYDESTDNTYNVIKKLAKDDNRIKIFNGPCAGVIKNFENALQNCKNEYIFLSDQDDIWLQNKIATVLSTFKSRNFDLIVHDCKIVNENCEEIYKSFFKFRHCRPGFLYNLMHNSYIGCCMALKKDFLKYVLPFPEKIPMHDQWIGLIAELKGNVKFLDIPLIKYRRHSNNLSALKSYNWCNIIKNRFNLIINLLKYNK